MKRYSLFILFLLVLPFISNAQEISWLELEQGLHYSSVESSIKSSHADSKIDILKIDPSYFNFNLLCAGEKKTESKTADKWCTEYKMIAGVNASMFKLEGDFKQSTGYMKNSKYINNGILNESYKNVFVFNSSKAHIADLSCEKWDELKTTYSGFSQSLRMLDCAGKNTWQLQQKKWSMVLLGEDSKGNILFIFVRSPYKVHEYINILKDLPINLKKLMYLEGGPEASFYINHPKLKLGKSGSYETGFNENDNNKVFWDIPNMITISSK